MILAAYLNLLVFGLLDNFRGPFFSAQLTEFSLSEGAGAAVFALTSIFASLSSTTGAGLLRRLGAGGLLNFSAFCMGAGFLCMAFSPLYAILLFGAALLGVGLGLAALAQNVAVAEYAPIQSRAKLMSGLHAMYALSSAASPWVAHGLLLAGWTWRQSFIAVALVPMMFSLAGVLWGRRTRRVIHAAPLSLQAQVWPKGTRRHVFLLAICTALYLWAEISVGTRLVRWFEVEHGGTAAQGSLYLMSFFAALLLGRLLSWRWAPHREQGLRRTLWASSVVAAGGLLWALWVWPWAVALAGLAMGPFYPLAMAYARVRFMDLAPQAYTLILGTGSAGVVMMHFLIGWSADNHGLQAAMQVGPLGLLLGLLILLFEARIKR